MRRLILNADDFGLTRGVNRAIIEAHRSGVVTSATLMANSPAFAEAVGLAHEFPGLSVGCHVVLVDGSPVSIPSAIPTLVTKRQPRFRDSLGMAGCALTSRLRPEEIEAETTAQIRKIQAAGVTVSHLDTHKHTHLFPAILEPILRAATACGVPAIRNPIEPSFVPAPPPSGKSWERRAQLRILETIAGNLRSRVHAAGLRTTDGTLGIVATGALTLELFRHIVDCIPDGTWEFVCHPGYVDDALRASGTRLLTSRQAELEILTSDAARRVLEDRGIQLISFHDLALQKPSPSITGRAQ